MNTTREGDDGWMHLQLLHEGISEHPERRLRRSPVGARK